MLSILSFVVLANAQEPPAKPLDLNPHMNYLPAEEPSGRKIEQGMIRTRERTVLVNGVQYKQIEYKGTYYTVNGRQPETYTDCSRANLPPDTFAADSTISVTKHTKFFLESLRQHCDPISNSVVTSPDIRDTNLGIKFKGDAPDSSEKKIFVNPLKRTGGVGTDF